MSETVIMNPFKLLWSFDGRIGRAAYAGGLLLSLVLMIIATAIVDELNRGAAFSLMKGHLPPLLAVVVFFIWANLALTAKRFQDLGSNGWFSLLLLIPLVGLIAPVVLLAARGEDKDNCYGPAPSTNDLAPAHHLNRDHTSADMPQRPSC
jgi:uncharacterized membrane protein YhaH (DUF805 family)